MVFIGILLTSAVCPRITRLLSLQTRVSLEPLSLWEFVCSASSSPWFQPAFLLFDFGAATSHYHENDQDVCQDEVKEEFPANSRPWADEKFGSSAELCSFESWACFLSSCLGIGRKSKFPSSPLWFEEPEPEKYRQMWRLQPQLGVKGYKQLLISTAET